jgi:YHS domain-containing protein
MKILRPFLVAVLFVSLCAAALTAVAADTKTQKLKPYTLKTCVVSGDKLGEMGDPFVYAYKGREIKFCCKGCLKDFNKNPDKYIKMIDAAEAKAKKAKS